MSNNKKPEGYLTWAQITALYPDVYVALGHPKFDKQTLLGGVFLSKNKNRLAIARRLIKMQQDGKLDGIPTYTTFTGEIKFPKNTVLCL